MDLGIAGRVAVVAGSSRGLGRASADALISEGAAVVLNGRDAEALEAAELALRARGGEVASLRGDASDPELPGRLVQCALDTFGRIDIVVANNHGPRPARALELDDDDLTGAFEANALAAIRLARAALPHLRAQGWGRICAIASHSVTQAIPTLALSNVARAGLWGWVKSAAYDLAGSGVTANLACPGPHATARMVELGASGAPLGDPEAFGRVVAFLCSEPAANVSGAALVVDGGTTLAL